MSGADTTSGVSQDNRAGKARVSVVIVNWKTPRLLDNCLKSIQGDSRRAELETIVVDNASGDDSLPMLDLNHPSVRIIANQENIGFPRACNQAISIATGQFVLLLNPDTVVVGDAISQMADFLDLNPGCGVVGPRVLNPDGTLQLACRRSFPDPLAAIFRVTYLSRLFPRHPVLARYNLTDKDPNQTLEVDAVSGSCMMVRRQAIDQAGTLDEEWFMYGEEIDWCWRIKQHGWTVFYYPGSTIYHYHGAASRLRPIRATFALHHGLALFYRKHIARRYWPIFNWLVYGGIWLRAVIFALLALSRGLIQKPDCSPDSIFPGDGERTGTGASTSPSRD